jgi:hypothetical protein
MISAEGLGQGAEGVSKRIFAKGETVRLFGGVSPQPVGGISWCDSSGVPNSSNEAFPPGVWGTVGCTGVPLRTTLAYSLLVIY